MRIKPYLRGLGAGIFASAVLMGIATSSKEKMTDEEIKQRAAELGMVEEEAVLVKPKADDQGSVVEITAPDKDKDGQENKDPGTSKTEGSKTDTAKAETEEKKSESAETEGSKTDTAKTGTEEKKTDTGKAETGEAKTDKDKTEGSKSDDSNDSETAKGSEKAAPANEDLAMGGNSGSKDAATEDTSEKATTAKDTSAGDTSKKDEVPSAEKAEASGESFTLQIAAGSSSYTVAKLLMKGGVIKDADDFDKYLCDNGYDHRINHGVFKIPAGADYEQIAGLITGKN